MKEQGIRTQQLERLYRIGLALSAERDRDRLMERILLEAKELCHADGGTIYLRTEEETLSFAIVRNDSLSIASGGSNGQTIDLPEIPLQDEDGSANYKNVASYCVHLSESVNIEDAYCEAGFDFSGTKGFDAQNKYRSQSFLTMPMKNQEDQVIGVLQLINARDESGQVIAFAEELQGVAEALAAQAAVALENQQLLEGQKKLLESFIKLIASAIDHKSPYTGGHCRRVPMLTEMLTRALCDSSEGAYRDFQLSEEEWYELHIAAWLHDCGKITTPVHIMDKSTKLETIHDRIHEVKLRFFALKQQTELNYLRRALKEQIPEEHWQEELSKELSQLDQELAFIETSNLGGEFMSPESLQKLQKIAQRTFVNPIGEERPLLSEEELSQLSIARGTLSHQERLQINGHMVQTVLMLEALPFPRNLKQVPEYACGHHERMDGNGYPRGIYAGDMSIPARVMAIADVFEALTASDRPYKPAKSLSETMQIMGRMKENNHLDPELFDFFISSGVYREYAQRFLSAELIDSVDEAALLAIEPKVYETPGKPQREQRWNSFLPEYQQLVGKEELS